MIATSKSKSRTTGSKPVSRSVRWLSRLDRCTGIVEIRLTFAKRSEFFRYFVSPVAIDYGVAGAALEKIGADGSCTGGEVYHVHLDTIRSSCTCKGNTFCGHCKHVEALTALVSVNKL